MVFGMTAFAAGILLGHWSGVLVELPGLIVLIPVAIGMRGNIFGALASGLGTRLHTGEMEPRLRTAGLGVNARVVTVQTLTMSLAAGALAYAMSWLAGFDTIGPMEMAFISLAGGLISAVPLFIATFAVATISYRKGFDPDNVTVPLVTALGDLMAVPSIIGAAYLVIVLPASTIGTATLMLVAAAAASLLLTRDREVRKRVGQSTPFLTSSALIMIASGLLLMKHQDLIFLYPAILVLLPPFNVESGNIGSILAARLSSANYMGLTTIGGRPDRLARTNLAAMLLVGIVILPVVGAVAGLLALSIGIGMPGLHTFVLIAALAGLVVSATAVLMAYYVTHFAIRIGYDPDNVVVPMITSMMDLVANATILTIAILLL